jgi:oligoendopeptidase F
MATLLKCRRLPLGLVIYTPHHPFCFYCYGYVFGQLLVLAVYRMYREAGKSFVPQYLALLESGGSASPEALLNPLGVNIHDPKFWQKGFDEIGGLVKRLEEWIEKVQQPGTSARQRD